MSLTLKEKRHLLKQHRMGHTFTVLADKHAMEVDDVRAAVNEAEAEEKRGPLKCAACDSRLRADNKAGVCNRCRGELSTEDYNAAVAKAKKAKSKAAAQLEPDEDPEPEEEDEPEEVEEIDEVEVDDEDPWPDLPAFDSLPIGYLIQCVEEAKRRLDHAEDLRAALER